MAFISHHGLWFVPGSAGLLLATQPELNFAQCAGREGGFEARGFLRDLQGVVEARQPRLGHARVVAQISRSRRRERICRCFCWLRVPSGWRCEVAESAAKVLR